MNQTDARIHLSHPILSCFTRCGILSLHKTDSVIDTTCFNCVRTRMFYETLESECENRKNRAMLMTYNEVIAIGRPKRRRGVNLLIKNLRINNDFLLDHIWIQTPRMRRSKIIVFKATTYRYINRDGLQSYGLKLNEILQRY